MPLPFAWSIGWRASLLDLGHLPLFAGLTCLFCWWLKPRLVVPVLLVVALAGSAEVAQHFVGRTASWLDFANGSLAAGATGFLFVAFRPPSKIRRIAPGIVLALMCVTWPLVRMGPVILDAAKGYEQFPTLAGFESDSEMRRWHGQQAETERRTDPAGHASARMTFHPGTEPYPSVLLSPIVHDLSEYRWICFDITSTSESLDLVVSIRGGPEDAGHTTHYQTGRRLLAGEQTLRVDLHAAASFSQPQALDLSQIWFVQLFLIKPTESRTVYLRRVWVEK